MLWSAVGHVCVSSHSCILLKYIWHLIRQWFILSVSRCHTMANLIVLVKLKGVISCLNPERCVPVQHTFTAVMFSFEHHQWPLIPPAFAVLFLLKNRPKATKALSATILFFSVKNKNMSFDSAGVVLSSQNPAVAGRWGVVTCPLFTISEVNLFFKSLLIYNPCCS